MTFIRWKSKKIKSFSPKLKRNLLGLYKWYLLTKVLIPYLEQTVHTDKIDMQIPMYGSEVSMTQMYLLGYGDGKECQKFQCVKACIHP